MRQWIELKWNERGTSAAIANPLPPGPYIKAPQHQTTYKEGMPWDKAWALAVIHGDNQPEIHITWGNEIWGCLGDQAFLIAYCYDTTD